MLHFSFQTAIGTLRVTTDWPALAQYLLDRQHPQPPVEERDVHIQVMLKTPTLTGSESLDAHPRLVRLLDAHFLVERDRIVGEVDPRSVHKGVVMEWLWYALAVLCAPDGWEAIHASAAVADGKAYVSAGDSHSGKTNQLLQWLTGGISTNGDGSEEDLASAWMLTDDILLIHASGLVRGWDMSLHLYPDQARSLGRETDTLDHAAKVRVRIEHISKFQEYPLANGSIAPPFPQHSGPGFDSAWRPRAIVDGKLRVLLLNRDHRRSWFGGDLVQVMGRRDGLRSLGVLADIQLNTHDNFDNWKVVHVFHAQGKWEQSPAVARAKKAGVPVVLSAITHGWPPREDLELGVLAADKVLCYSEEEADYYRDLFPEEPQEKFVAVVMGVPEATLAPHDTRPQLQPRVFCAGTYHECKGQLHLLRVCRKLSVPVNFAGPMDKPESQDYLMKLKEAAEGWDGARFFGLLHGDSLWNQYRAAHVHVDPANFAPFGLASLEALACGANIVHPQDSWGASLFGQHGTLCDARDEDALYEAVCYELKQPRDRHGWRPASWSDVASSLITVYHEVLDGSTTAHN